MKSGSERWTIAKLLAEKEARLAKRPIKKEEDESKIRSLVVLVIPSTRSNA